MKAIWNENVIAQSDNTVTLDGDIYFPFASLFKGYFRQSPDKSYCPSRGQSTFWDLVVEGKLKANAAVSYKQPIKDHAKCIKGMVKFADDVKLSN